MHALRVPWYLAAAAGLVLAAAPVAAQRTGEVDATGRLFPEVSAGVAGLKSRTVGEGENAERLYYLLIPALRTAGAQGATILVFKPDGTRVAQIPAPVARSGQTAASASAEDLSAVQASDALVVYAHDFDVDAQGRVFIADRAAGAVRIFNADGAAAGGIRVTAPASVAALPTGEVAVTSLRGSKLITVYAEGADASGKPAWRPVREFGEPAEIADAEASPDLNRFLNIGRLATDADSDIYYAFAYAPEPTVRKYDAFGYRTYEAELATLDFLATAQATRRNIDRLGQSRFTLGTVINPGFTATVTAVAADPATQDVFVAMGAQLLHIDREGIYRNSWRLFTSDGIRVEVSAILVEPDRLIIASDTRGVFAFPRVDKPRRPASKPPAN